MIGGFLSGLSDVTSGLTGGPATSGARSDAVGDSGSNQTAFFGGASKQTFPTWATVALVGAVAVYAFRKKK
jgi:hypothetical protein